MTGLTIGGGRNTSLGPGADPEGGADSPTPGVPELTGGCDSSAPGAVGVGFESIIARGSGATRRTRV